MSSAMALLQTVVIKPFALHLPNPERVDANLDSVAMASKGLSDGDILNVWVNSVFNGSADPDSVPRWSRLGVKAMAPLATSSWSFSAWCFASTICLNDRSDWYLFGFSTQTTARFRSPCHRLAFGHAAASRSPPAGQPAVAQSQRYDDFLKAASLLRGDMIDASTLGHDDLWALVTSNAQALALARLGLSRACSAHTDSLITNFSGLGSEWMGFRNLAFLLAEEGRLAELENRNALMPSASGMKSAEAEPLSSASRPLPWKALGGSRWQNWHPNLTARKAIPSSLNWRRWMRPRLPGKKYFEQ